MSLAAIIVGQLSSMDIAFRKDGKNLTNNEAIDLMRDVVCKSILAPSQGGLRQEKYICDTCAKKVRGE